MVGLVMLCALAQVAVQRPTGRLTVDVVDRRSDPQVPHHATVQWRRNLEGEVVHEWAIEVGRSEWELPTGSWLYQVQGDSIAECRGLVRVEAKSGPTKLDDILLQDGTTIEGRVLDPDGEPVAAAPVYVWRPRDSPRDVPQQWEARTGEDGRYHLEHLRPGRLFVWSTVAPFAVMRPPPRDVLDGEARHVELKLEKPCQIQLVLEGTNSATVCCFQGESPLDDLEALSLSLSLGPPPTLPWRMLDLEPHEQEALRPGARIRDGRLSIGRLLPGRHRLLISAEGFRGYVTEVVLVPGGQEVVIAKLEPRDHR